MKRLYLVFVSVLMMIQLFGQSHGPVISMDSTQYVDQTTLATGKSDPVYFSYGDTITIEGIVTFNPIYYGLSSNRKAAWLQGETFKPFNSANVFIEPTISGYSGTLQQLNDETKFYEHFLPGYKVKCTGILANYDENTQINLIPIESEIVDIPSNIDTLLPVKPLYLNIDLFSKNDGSGGQKVMHTTGEQYEGMFVQFNNVTVVDVSAYNAERWNWAVMDSAGNKINIRDVSAYYRNDIRHDATWVNDYHFEPPTIGTRLNYIRGILVQSYAGGAGGTEYRLSPVFPSDMSIAAAAPYISKVSRKPIIASSTDNITIYAEISDNDGNITSASVNYSVGIGNKTFTSVLMTDLGGNQYSGIIPAQADGSFINFYIAAKDDSNQMAFYPDSLATGSIFKITNKGITKISDIQETPFSSGNSIWRGDTLLNINLNAIVTSTLDQLGYFTIQDGTDPYSGIFLKAVSNDGLANLKIGDNIEITSAIVQEEYGVTYLLNTGNSNHKHLSSGNTLPSPIKSISPDSIHAQIQKYSEAYEGMLLEFNDIFVVDLNADGEITPNYGEFVMGIDKDTVLGLRVDVDQSNYFDADFNMDSLSLGQQLSFVKGILYYSFSNYKLLPRDKDDIAGYNSRYIPMADFTSDITSGNTPVTVKFTDKTSNSPYSLTYKWTFQGGTPETSTDMNPTVIYNTAGTFSVKLKVSNMDGEDSITKSNYISSVGFKEFEHINGMIIYPNPVANEINVSGNSKIQDLMNINIYDISGKLVITNQKSINGNFNLKIDVSDLEKGLYIIHFVSGNGSKATSKFIK